MYIKAAHAAEELQSSSSGSRAAASGRASLQRKLILEQGSAGGSGSGSISQGSKLPALDLPSLQSNEFYKRSADRWEHGPNGEALHSAKFAPMRVSACTERMPKHWAPCINITGVGILYAEEVIYPPHKVLLC
jgi:hypothetical protein